MSVKAAQIRAEDERLYEVVAQELDRGERRPGLWAKATADSDGSEDKAGSLYIKYRVQSLKDERGQKFYDAEAFVKEGLEGEYQSQLLAHKNLIDTLEQCRYTVKRGRELGATKWVVKEPFGERVSFSVYDDFKRYADQVIRKEIEKADGGAGERTGGDVPAVPQDLVALQRVLPVLIVLLIIGSLLMAL